MSEIKPDYWAVQSATNSHIGLWSDEAFARKIMPEYPGCTIIPLYASPPAVTPAAVDPATRVGQLATETIAMAEKGGIYVGITIRETGEFMSSLEVTEEMVERALDAGPYGKRVRVRHFLDGRKEEKAHIMRAALTAALRGAP